MVRFVRATVEHIAELAPKLRKVDREEIEAMTSEAPEQALWQSFYNSRMRWAIVLDDEVVGVFGCGDGVPWLLGSENLPKAGPAIGRNSKRYIDYMLRQYGTLFNYVHAKNKLAIKWLRWCGFTINPPVILGSKGEKFHPFYMITKEAKCASKLLA